MEMHSKDLPSWVYETTWSEPATTANQITYDYFCTLGGLSNPRCTKVMRHNGTHSYATYHLANY